MPSRSPCDRHRTALVRRVALAALPFLSLLQQLPSARADDVPGPPPIAAAEPSQDGNDNATRYCQNIANAAADARFARQAAALAAMEKQIDDRIAKLEAKRAEYEDWLGKREEFLKKADDSLVAVVSQMRPDAAAAQMTVMGDDSAAAILAKLNPRVASAILNEMEPKRAATLTGTMAGISRRADSESKS